jgi:hypothetical protein
MSALAITFGMWILYRSFTKETQVSKEIISEEWKEYKYLNDIYSDDDITEGTCIDFARHVSRILKDAQKGIVIFNIFAVCIIIIGGYTLIDIINNIIK